MSIRRDTINTPTIAELCRLSQWITENKNVYYVVLNVWEYLNKTSDTHSFWNEIGNILCWLTINKYDTFGRDNMLQFLNLD